MTAVLDAAPAAAIVLLVALALYLNAKGQGKAALVSFLAALLVGVAWYGSRSERTALKEQLDSARGEIASLEDTSGQRTFDPVARELMVRRLRDFVGPTAFVVTNSSDPETVEYARQIVAVLKDAGWRVPPSFGMLYQPIVLPGDESTRPGVVLGVLPDVPRDFSTSILRVFREGGIDVVEGPHWPGTEHPISILVGPKPSP
jgi:hypothetical protein